MKTFITIKLIEEEAGEEKKKRLIGDELCVDFSIILHAS